MSDLVERLRSADMNSQQRALGSPIFGEAADEITRLRAALADAQARVLKLEERLEITHCSVLRDGELVDEEIPPEERHSFPDGIECRDATIAELDRQIASRHETIRKLMDAQVVGFAAGVEAAAKAGSDAAIQVALRQNPDLSPLRQQLIKQAIANPIRALTPPDLTAAAARVLLDDLAKSHTDHPDAHDRWQRINAAMGGSVGPWLVFIDALSVIAGDTP